MRVLSADVYDTLELSAWEFGGIGAGRSTDHVGAPLCVHGHALDSPDMRLAFYSAELSAVASDIAVRAINASTGNALNARVPFSRWCAELGVVRGE